MPNLGAGLSQRTYVCAHAYTCVLGINPEPHKCTVLSLTLDYIPGLKALCGEGAALGF